MPPVPRDRFVNPYTFVPLPASGVRRASPPLHTEGPEEKRFTGSFTVEWTLQTPLLLPAKAQEEGWLRPDGTVRIPGSAVKGSVRSVHETLFNGCLRIFDSEFLPGYRLPARSGAESDDAPAVLAVVTRSRDGVPLEVAPCDGVEWVESTSLRKAYADRRINRLPRTGDIVTISGVREASELRQANEVFKVTGVSPVSRAAVSRDESATAEAALPDQGSVLLITDTSARRPTRKDGTPADCFWAAGIIGSAQRAVVPEQAAKQFWSACEGSRDRQELRQGERRGDATDWKGATQYARVKWQGQPVGERARATGFLHAGDVVWVTLSVDEATVESIRLARIWRETGTANAGERVPSSLLPCWTIQPGDPRPGTRGPDGGLCLSCTIFGSADTSGAQSGEGRQDAYAGHVRFGSARSAVRVRPLDVQLAPLSSPRLGAGVFTLVDRGTSEELGDIASHWGSTVDQPEPRQLRGRKFYWHVDPDQQAERWTSELRRTTPVLPRYKARDHQSRKGLSRAAQLVPAGTTLTQEITFEGLDDVALQSLLIAIDPARLLTLYRPSARIATHLGGGKPFGLGAVSARITAFSMWHSGDRYGAAATALPDPGFDRSAYPRIVARAGRLENPRAVARLLDLDGAGDWRDHVAYPPGATWDQIDVPNKDRFVPFDESYHFFGEANGERLAGKPSHGIPPHNRPWHPLPPVVEKDGSDARPDLPINPERRGGRR